MIRHSPYLLAALSFRSSYFLHLPTEHSKPFPPNPSPTVQSLLPSPTNCIHIFPSSSAISAVCERADSSSREPACKRLTQSPRRRERGHFARSHAAVRKTEPGRNTFPCPPTSSADFVCSSIRQSIFQAFNLASFPHTVLYHFNRLEGACMSPATFERPSRTRGLRLWTLCNFQPCGVRAMHFCHLVAAAQPHSACLPLPAPSPLYMALRAAHFGARHPCHRRSPFSEPSSHLH